MKLLTREQKRVFSFVLKQLKRMGVPPTIREITAGLKYKSINNARQHLQLMERKGYIRLHKGKARGIEILVGVEHESGNNEVQVPLIGAVAAGVPITAIENMEGHITLDRDMFSGDGLFTLRIKGDSMVNIGVLDGDFVIVQQQNSAEDGDIIVAIIENEATLKRYIKKRGGVILRAENPKYDDIVVPSDRGVWIAGKMVGVIRKC
jgi:repressor LexA